MEINSYLLRERVNVGNFAAGGVIGTAAATVDIISDIGVAQTTVGQTLTLPTPTDPRNGRSVSVANAGTVPFVMNGISIGPGSFSTFEWHGTTWRTHVGLAGSDFWRDTTAARNVPDGSVDVSEGVVHTGAVHMGADGVAGEQGFHHEAIVSYQGNGNFVNQLIQTTIPVDSSIMPTVFLKGYCYGTSDTVDLQVSFYVYGSPTGTTLNHVWTSSGSKTPTQIRLGYVGGFMAIELTWPVAEYFNRFEVSAYCDGNSNHQAEWFQGWTVTSAVMPGTVVNPVVATRKYAELAKVVDFDLQHLLQLNGRAAVSLVGQVSWSGRFITMTAGARTQELSGYHDINMPAVGTNILDTNGNARAVVAATAGQNGLSGGIPLGSWETLWYRVQKNTGNGSVNANFRIAAYGVNGNPTNLNSLLGVSNSDPSEWVLIVSRDDSDQFKWGTGDTTRLGFQFGQGMDIQTVVDFRQQLGMTMEGGGFAFRPWNLTNSLVSFGFTNQLRMISGAANSQDQRVSGYTDIGVPAVGTIVYGLSGAANKTWRATNANDAMARFGVDAGNVPAATPVIDLDEYNVLWFAPDQATSVNGGTWYYSRYDFGHVIPSHWVRIAQRRDSAQDILLWTGENLKRGEILAKGNHEQVLHRSRGEITSNGQFDCRWTQPNFFAGTGANGLNTSSSTAGVLIHWPNNSMMWGMDSGTQAGGNYIWLDMPTAGYAIPMLDAAGTRTRVVQTIGGRSYVPLGAWESLVHISGQYQSGSSTNAGWFIVNYGDARFLPVHAITVASYASPSSVAGSGTAKTRVKMGDGTYIQPGISTAVGTPTLNDHATGTSLDWRPAVIAGQTPPAAAAALPAVAGVSNNNFVYRYVSNQHDVRGRIELAGSINATAAIAGGAVIAFLPGVQPLAQEQSPIGVVVRHANNNDVPGIAFVLLVPATIGGQIGTSVTLLGYTAANNSAQNGGAYGAGGLISFAGLSFAHS